MTDTTREPDLILGAGTAVSLPLDTVSTSLAEIALKNRKMTELAEHGRALHLQFKDVAFDVSTTKGMESAKAARHQLRTEVRYPMQNLQEEGSKMLGTMQRQFNTRAKELIAEAEKHETPIHEQITAEEERKATEKAAAEQVERERVEAINAEIEAIRQRPVQLVGATADEVQTALNELRAEADEANEEDFDELAPQAKRAYAGALEQLQGMLVAKRLDEQNAAEAEQQRIAMAAQQQAMAAQQRKMDEQAAELKKQQEELAAQQKAAADAAAEKARAAEQRLQAIAQRIAAMKNLPAELDGSTAAGIGLAISTLERTAILPGDYEHQLADAEQARDTALEELRAMHAVAVEREEAARVAAAAAAEQRAEEERARREADERRAAVQAALQRQQAAGPKLLALLREAFDMLDESLLRDTFGSDWVARALVVMSEAGDAPITTALTDDDLGIDDAIEDKETADQAVLRIVANVFGLPPGDHIRALSFRGGIGADDEDMAILLEEINIGFQLQPGTIDGAGENVAELIARIEKELA